MLVGAAPYALPTQVTLLPEYLASAGYQSQAVGKWHLGSHNARVTPTNRGFLSHTGYWTGHEDYYDHTAQELYGPVVSYHGSCLNHTRGCLLVALCPLGLYHHTIASDAPYGLPLHLTTLPTYLAQLSYTTHHVGKWHLGFCTSDYTPTARGFTSHTGYWAGMQDYYDHTIYTHHRQGVGTIVQTCPI